jgi:lipoprotein-anchoring transpeptidase ErfK/SrfK
MEASFAAHIARDHLADTFGVEAVPNGKFLWRKDAGKRSVDRVVISLSNQKAFAYSGDELIGVSTISSGKPGKDTPTGIFSVLDKQRTYFSKKYDNAPMPFMQRIDQYGIALHAGHLPGRPASHGCVRLPKEFAAKLFAATKVGTEVWIGS